MFEYSDSTKFNEIHYFDSKWDHEDGRNTVLFVSMGQRNGHTSEEMQKLLINREREFFTR